MKKKQGTKLQFLWMVILFVIVSAFLTAAIMLAMLQKKPRAYALTPPPPKTKQVSPYLTHYLAPNVNNNIQSDEPFEIIVPQKNLNEIIAVESSLGWKWPVVYPNVIISRPVAIFDTSKIMLMGKVDIVGFETVITICATPKIGEDGLLSLNLQYIRAGALDISYLAKKTIKKVIESQLSEAKEQYWLKDILGACVNNTPFKPIFPTVYDRHITLIKSEISKKMLILLFMPSTEEEIADRILPDKNPDIAE